jgi:L-rhamnonate dehydratase
MISNPMSIYKKYQNSRTSWGIGVLGSILIEIELTNGLIGVANGFGGPPACWLIKNHFSRFLIGEDPRNINLIWD